MRIRVASVIPLILLLSLPAFALNPSQDISQYGHAAWLLRDGAFKGYPSSFAQTPDGYLWLGSELGVLRFDGVRFVPWQPPAGTPLPSSFVIKLLTARDGSLWIGTSEGLARWLNGALTTYPELAGQYIGALVEDREGTVWAGTTGRSAESARLCAIQSVRVQCYGSDGTLGQLVLSLYEDGRGNLWVGASTGLWRWRPAPAKVYPIRTTSTEVRSIIEGDNGTVLIAVDREIKRVADQNLETYPVQDAGWQPRPTVMLRDRDGGLWIGNQDHGLLHVHRGRTDRFTRADGLSGDLVVGLFEDREGSIWVATLGGLDRFRETVVTTVSTRQGLSSDNVVSVLATADRSVWIGTIDGLNRWQQGQIAAYSSRRGLLNDAGSSLFQDNRGRPWVSSPPGRVYLQQGPFSSLSVGGSGYVSDIVWGGEKDLWVSDQERGLFRFHEQQVIEVIPWAKLGGGSAGALAYDPVRGGLWLGFFRGGVSFLKNGEIRESYGTAANLGHGEVTGLFLEQDGTLWATTEGGLSRLKDGRVTTLTSRNGLPCDAVSWAIEDDDRSLWLRTACGLVRIARAELEAWVRDPKRTIQLTTYDDSDGLSSHSDLSFYRPKVTKAADGRLWFATFDGAGVVDPRHIPFNRLAPPVHIEEITADRNTYTPSSGLRLPPLVRDLRIDYTALSLVAPQKVRFRYRLEGRDQDWVDAGSRRQAFYTDLPPRAYRFRVIAANNDGVWNEEGAALEFSVLPTFYQTNTFRLAIVVFVGGLLWAAFALRVRRLATQMNVRFEERLAERTRIAQELHDTLLQGSLSASMQLHVLADEVSDSRLKGKLDRILQRFRQMNEEGRRAVQTLRRSADPADDLEQALARGAEDLRGDQAVNVRVVVEGAHRPLHPIIRDECYRIGCEALANALRHAHATGIVIGFDYTPDHLTVAIGDNGRGIDPSLLESVQDGHWGIRGMRERAEQIGGTVKISSRIDVGTEVELRVPAHLAFAPAASGLRHQQGSLLGVKAWLLSISSSWRERL